MNKLHEGPEGWFIRKNSIRITDFVVVKKENGKGTLAIDCDTESIASYWDTADFKTFDSALLALYSYPEKVV